MEAIRIMSLFPGAIPDKEARTHPFVDPSTVVGDRVLVRVFPFAPSAGWLPGVVKRLVRGEKSEAVTAWVDVEGTKLGEVPRPLGWCRKVAA